jgi:hypothetical protein
LERRVNPRIGSRIPEQVELGNRIHEHKTSENKQKEKKEETAPAIKYTGLL